MSLYDAARDAYGLAHQWLFETVVQPLVFGLGYGNLLEDAYGATGWLLAGLVQLTVAVLVIGALQRWRPVEPLVDRPAVRTDILYTLIHTLGLFRLGTFFLLEPLVLALGNQLRMAGVPPWQPDQLWPGVTDGPWASFFIYLLLFDLADYAIHRAQHAFGPWWALHAVHHSQRQMTMWSDSRNHLLDSLIRDGLIALLALIVGVGPGQFVAIVVVTRLIEQLSHANLRLDFGPWLGRVLVSPAYHRAHHAIGLGHETETGRLGSHNLAVLFPVWDLIFGTARYDLPPMPTGIRDQLPQQGGRDYGRGFWAQQWLGLLRLAGRA